MRIYLPLVAVIVEWKGYYAVLRAIRSYRQDRKEHDSLREYLVANGATRWQSLWPFYRHALQRAFVPMKAQWQLWALLLAIGIIIMLTGC